MTNEYVSNIRRMVRNATNEAARWGRAYYVVGFVTGVGLIYYDDKGRCPSVNPV